MSNRRRTLPYRATLAGYDLWSQHYDADDNPLIAATGWALDRRPLGAAGAKVVELGCGTGRNVARILAEGARAYLGVDGSPGMLDRARQRVLDPRCRWLAHDVASSPDLGVGAFDLAVIVLVIEHLADLAPPLAAIARALRPGGRLRIVDLHPDRVAAGTVAHFAHGAGEVRFTSVVHRVEDLAAAVARAGMVTERVDEDRADPDLVAAVPRLGKHRGERIVVDLAARRP
jgi:SAM-dependent methyltransferase